MKAILAAIALLMGSPNVYLSGDGSQTIYLYRKVSHESCAKAAKKLGAAHMEYTGATSVNLVQQGNCKLFVNN